MTKGTPPAQKSGLFLGSEMNIRSTMNGRTVNCATSQEKVAHRRRSGKETQPRNGGLVDAVIGGERVLLATDPAPREKGIELQIRAAVDAAGVMCMKHHVDQRSPFGRGLGLGVADLICIVPPHGRFCAIEIKRPGYSPSDVRPEQRKWMAVVRRYNGVVGIATSIEEAFRLIDMARRLPT